MFHEPRSVPPAHPAQGARWLVAVCVAPPVLSRSHGLPRVGRRDDDVETMRWIVLHVRDSNVVPGQVRCLLVSGVGAERTIRRCSAESTGISEAILDATSNGLGLRAPLPRDGERSRQRPRSRSLWTLTVAVRAQNVGHSEPCGGPASPGRSRPPDLCFRARGGVVVTAGRALGSDGAGARRLRAARRLLTRRIAEVSALRHASARARPWS